MHDRHTPLLNVTIKSFRDISVSPTRAHLHNEKMDNLPEELLSRIFQDLPTKELGTLSTVNHKFSRIATPFLYSKCDLADSATRDQHRSVKAILNTLVARPELRSLAQEIHIGDWPNCGRGPEDREDRMRQKISMTAVSDIIQCMLALRNCPDAFQYDVGMNLLECTQGAMTAAILSMLPNLTKISFNKNPRDWRNRYHDDPDYATGLTLQLIDLSATSALIGTSLMHSVSYISVGGKTDPDHVGWDVGAVFMCLRLPTLQNFVAGGCQDSEWSLNWRGEDQVSNATDVTLYDCSIETETIQKLLRFCRALRRFKCARICQRDGTSYDAHYTYSYVGLHRDLFRHRESLHSLHLHTKSCGHNNCWDHNPIKSLAALENLKFLEVDEDALFGIEETSARPFAEILPASLKHIIIKGELYDSQRDVIEEIRKALLRGGMQTTFEVEDGCIKEAECVLTCYPVIKLEEITDRYQVEGRTICSFLIYKREDERREA